ncbi:hypothetical protein SNOG_12314 [Parastagonospora nodorum SN15]|uniref:Uncharacterized protein n=1 Tax=Phaeosphaeria nodorum (strain SN15 / ATCC MYA-4574 / FGSC 10173) TaxID=321614 RepID=Q0U7F0_PHANO|nr:hypothetical protein SNOG_12314 [Parastagonospora nodorum SN15]EAT80127.2 hypothetical protein SNOG_12314 [Parastagonospora nodorum SN15]
MSLLRKGDHWIINFSAFWETRKWKNRWKEKSLQLQAKKKARHRRIKPFEVATITTSSKSRLAKWNLSEQMELTASIERSTTCCSESSEAKERSLEEKIQWMTKTSIDGCNRARIKKWLSEVATDPEVAVLSIEDTVKLWKEPGYQSTTKQNRMKVSTGAGISRNTLDGNMSVDDGDEEWVFVTREETATIPIFGSECSDRTPHLKIVFSDSASIFDGDFNYRGDIDKCARNLRNGYY